MKGSERTVFRRRNIGFVFQNYNLMPVLDVEEDITLSSRHRVLVAADCLVGLKFLWLRGVREEIVPGSIAEAQGGLQVTLIVTDPERTDDGLIAVDEFFDGRLFLGLVLTLQLQDGELHVLTGIFPNVLRLIWVHCHTNNPLSKINCYQQIYYNIYAPCLLN